jgi:hypothetical protein
MAAPAAAAGGGALFWHPQTARPKTTKLNPERYFKAVFLASSVGFSGRADFGPGFVVMEDTRE